MTHVTCMLTAKNRDQLRNPTLGNRVWATFTFLSSKIFSGSLMGSRPHRPHGSATAVHRTCIDHAQPLLWLAIPKLLNIRIFNSFGYTLLFLMSITVV